MSSGTYDTNISPLFELSTHWIPKLTEASSHYFPRITNVYLSFIRQLYPGLVIKDNCYLCPHRRQLRIPHRRPRLPKESSTLGVPAAEVRHLYSSAPRHAALTVKQLWNQKNMWLCDTLLLKFRCVQILSILYSMSVPYRGWRNKMLILVFILLLHCLKTNRLKYTGCPFQTTHISKAHGKKLQ